MSTLPRVATAPELVKIRSENQSSRIFLTVHQPATVFTARLAAVPDSTDNVASITYNTGSGAGYTDITIGQTMYVGTSAGAYDLGMVRIRTLSGLGATTGTFNIGLTSEISWASNCYLTVVDAFDFWPRSPYGANMDYDVAYTDQHSHCASIPIFPRYHVKWMTGASTTVVLDGSQSWTIGNTITNYAWHAPGNSAISGDTTNTVTITYNALNAHAGYRVELDLTNSDGVDSAGFGRVFVLGSEADAITQFRVDSLAGSYSNGGWSAQITLWDSDADLTSIRDRALCIIHRRDWYGPRASDEGSIGYITGDENIEMVGWIAGETIRWSPHWNGEESVTFTIEGPQYWLNKLTMPAVGLKNIQSHPPTNWKRFMGLTAKVATWHILHWRTTAPLVIDCFMIDNNWGALQLQGSGAQTVWQQLTTVLNDFLLAKPCCDAYSRLFMQIEQNLLPAATRSSIVTVMTVTTGDWENQIDFERREVLDVAAVDFSGDVYNGLTSIPTYALSPGRTIGSRGSSVFQRDRLVLIDQATTNAMAGAAMGWQNNPYPKWKFQFPSNLHLIDLAPYQYLATDIATSDTQRGISVTGLRLIPRAIRRVFANGQIDTEVDVEAETLIYPSVTGDTPPDPPTISVTPPPPPPPPPPPVPQPTGNAREVWFATANAIYWAGDYFLGGQPTWNKITTLPSGTPDSFQITRTGVAYMHTGSGWFQCTAPKATTPSWANILQTGDSAGGGFTINGTYGLSVVYGAELITIPSVLPLQGFPTFKYGTFSGTVWSFGNYIISNQSSLYGVGKGMYTRTVGIAHDYAFNDSNVQIDFAGYYTSGGEMLLAGDGARYMLSIPTAGAAMIVREINSASNVMTSGYTAGTAFGFLRGTLGAASYAVFPDGTLYSSLAAWANIATWDYGWANDAQSTGGGSLVWILRSITSSNIPTRLYTQAGAVLRDMTGNFWSLTTGNQTVIGCGLVF